LVKVEDGSVKEVKSSLEALPEVVEAYAVLGMYEIFARIHTDEMPGLQEFVSSKVDQMEGVGTTLTLILIDPEKPKSGVPE
jgi:DNA-binding Lrp family transcriptional regulator